MNDTKATIISDSIADVYERGICIPTRRLFLFSSTNTEDRGDVDTSMAEQVLKGLHVLATYPYENDKPIVCILNTCGGSYYDGLAIYDAISNCPVEVHVHVYGQASSVGAVILQAADMRLLAPNATMMLHHGTSTYEGNANPEIRRNNDIEERRKARLMENILLRRIREKRRQFSLIKLKKLMNEVHFTPQEAIRYGLADGIISSP